VAESCLCWCAYQYGDSAHAAEGLRCPEIRSGVHLMRRIRAKTEKQTKQTKTKNRQRQKTDKKRKKKKQ
jgi:hypothetical protein